jgi:hypothetical protein
VLQHFVKRPDTFSTVFPTCTKSRSTVSSTDPKLFDSSADPKPFSTVFHHTESFFNSGPRPFQFILIDLKLFQQLFSTDRKLFQLFFSSPDMFSTLFQQTQNLFNSLAIDTMCFLPFSNKPKALLTTKNKVVSTSFPTESKLVQHFFDRPKALSTFLPTDQTCFNSSFNRPKVF